MTISNSKSNQQQTQQNINQIINFIPCLELMVFFTNGRCKDTLYQISESNVIKKPLWPHIKLSIKAEMRARSEGITGEKVQLSPKIQEDNFIAVNKKDYSAYK